MTTLTQATRTQEQTSVEVQRTHLFTLTFVGGQIALLNVCGAHSQQEARAIAESAIKNSRYGVVAGDSTGGHAHCFYYWHVQAQEQTPRLDSLSQGA